MTALRRTLPARPLPARLLRDDSGVTIVEFALIAPALMLSLLGILELGYEMYAQTMLQGSIQQAARSSTIEGANTTTATIDARVSTAVRHIVPDATIAFNRQSYSNFQDVGQPEDYTDTNANNACDNGEPFEDANGNDTWDADRGVAGLGGARDAVLYTVTVSYPRPFPLAGLIPGMSNTLSTQAVTVLRNQPYDEQHSVAKLGFCA